MSDKRKPKVSFFDMEYMATSIADEHSLEDEAYMERRSAELVCWLEKEFAAQYWKLLAWKLRAIHNWSMDRVVQHMRDIRVSAGKDAVRKAIAEVAAKLQEAAKDEDGNV